MWPSVWCCECVLAARTVQYVRAACSEPPKSGCCCESVLATRAVHYVRAACSEPPECEVSCESYESVSKIQLRELYELTVSAQILSVLCTARLVTMGIRWEPTRLCCAQLDCSACSDKWHRLSAGSHRWLWLCDRSACFTYELECYTVLLISLVLSDSIDCSAVLMSIEFWLNTFCLLNYSIRFRSVYLSTCVVLVYYISLGSFKFIVNDLGS